MSLSSSFIHPHTTHASDPLACLGSLIRHRQLILQMIGRELQSRYQGSWLGWAWSLITPMLMLLVYTFVFGVVFKAHWATTLPAGQGMFAMVLFIGVLAHGLISEVLNRAPTSVLAHPNYVKKVVFPIEILPVVQLAAALAHTMLAMSVLVVALAIQHQLHWSVLWAPVVMLPFTLLTLGLAWFLASVGVFLRDTTLIMPMLTMAMMFMAPVFYPLNAVPAAFRRLMSLNPLTFIIEQLRAVMVLGQAPDLVGLAAYSTIACLLACLGFAWFQKTRKGFADVL
jgi:lipopolysaccharide transport system permease protein